MGKICIVMAYYDRQYQLNKTLQSIEKSEHKDFSVIIVDDNSPQDIVVPAVPYEVEVIKLRKKSWTNCGPVYNIGFNKALEKNPDKIMIQSTECYHVGDVLSHADENVTDDNYIAYACFQVDKETTFKPHDIMELSNTNVKVTTDNHGAGQNGWWNHSKYFVQPQYWGAVIKAKNLAKINGIDERFAHGYAIEDGWFMDQVRRAGMRIDIVDYPFVVHQWHKRLYPKGTLEMVKQNTALWESLLKTNEYKSLHHITPNLVWSGS